MDMMPDYSTAFPVLLEPLPGVVMQIDPAYEAIRFTYSAALLTKYGVKYSSSGRKTTPPGVETAPGRCFTSAVNLMQAYPDRFTYCEGKVIVGDVIMHHAWCVDQDGTVFDLTFPTDAREEIWYFGIPFKKEYVLSWRRQMGFDGLLDGHPVYGKSLGVHKDSPDNWLSKEV